MTSGIAQRGTFVGNSNYIGYIGEKYNSRLVYDPTCPDIDHGVFKVCNWTELYWDIKEAIPINVPKHMAMR